MNAQTTTVAEDKRYFQIADMTGKERRILAMLVLGFSIDEMAADLCISASYVCGFWPGPTRQWSCVPWAWVSSSPTSSS